MEEVVMRSLTREEQLEWLVSFLEDEIKNYELELAEAKRELQMLRDQKDDLTLIRKIG